jgi:hypothetical protein
MLIGGLNQPIHDAANDTIADGTDLITKPHLDDLLGALVTINQPDSHSRPRPRTE